jgi:hypothetical protein
MVTLFSGSQDASINALAPPPMTTICIYYIPFFIKASPASTTKSCQYMGYKAPKKPNGIHSPLDGKARGFSRRGILPNSYIRVPLLIPLVQQSREPESLLPQNRGGAFRFHKEHLH